MTIHQQIYNNLITNAKIALGLVFLNLPLKHISPFTHFSYIWGINHWTMPKIFEYFGLVFFFFSNEHEPIHVHVTIGERESIFELIMNDGKLSNIKQRSKQGKTPLTDKEAHTAKLFINHYHSNIIEKWISFFVLKKKIRSTTITKKI